MYAISCCLHSNKAAVETAATRAELGTAAGWTRTDTARKTVVDSGERRYYVVSQGLISSCKIAHHLNGFVAKSKIKFDNPEAPDREGRECHSRVTIPGMVTLCAGGELHPDSCRGRVSSEALQAQSLCSQQCPVLATQLVRQYGTSITPESDPRGGMSQRLLVSERSSKGESRILYA